jgi:hypothetical protein
MTESNHSQTQQNAHPWKQLIDGQLDLLNTLYEQATKLRDQGLEQSASAFDELTRSTKDSVRHATELFAAQQHVDTWKKALDKQFEHASGVADAFNKMTKTPVDHAVKLSRAWKDVTVDAAERATSWTDSV